MYMTMLERILLRYLVNNKLTMEIIGFDMNAFSKAMHTEMKERLEMVESIIFADDDLISDEDKVGALKELFQNDFYNED